jgi:membrane-anchored protein YejM (alkaline phosphatase superfamily)
LANPPAPSPRLGLLRRSLWCLLLNIVIAIIISLRYWKNAAPQGALDWSFLGMATAGHWALVGSLLWVNLAMPAVLLWPKRGMLLPFALASASGLTLLVADTVVFGIYHYHIDPFFLLMLRDGGASGFFDMSPRTRLTIGLGFSFFLLLQLGIFWMAGRLRRGGAMLCVGLLVCLVGAHTQHAWASAAGRQSLTQLAEFLPAFYGLTANKWLKSHGVAVAPRPSLRTGTGLLLYPRVLLRGSADQHPDILLVVVESWRYEALRAEVMPATSAFAAAHLKFRQHHSSGNSTQPGMAGLLYGIHATYWKSITGADGAGGPILLRQLGARAYRFFAASSRDGLARLRFDHLFFGSLPPDRLILRLHDGTGPESDRANVDDFAQFLDTNGENPYFGLIFFGSTHGRYHFPPDYTPRFLPTKPAEIAAFTADTDPTPHYNQYLNAAGFLDTQLARLYSLLGPRMDHTIVMITGDHGESFNEQHRNDWGHGVDFSDLQTHVPLIVHWPGRAAATYDHLSVHEDLSPTLLQALGCENPISDYSNGQNLFDFTPRSARVVAGYVGYAIVTRKEIVSQLGGLMRITDLALNPKKSVEDIEGLSAGLSQTHRFYR